MLNSVVLPAPLGPMTAKRLALLDVEADPVVGDEAAEAHRDVMHGEERHGRHSALRGRGRAGC